MAKDDTKYVIEGVADNLGKSKNLSKVSTTLLIRVHL